MISSLYSYRHHLPYAVQVCLTEGCSLRCAFCGVKSITAKQGQYRFMTLDTAQHVARELGDLSQKRDWHPRLTFAVFGEPSMNPDMLGIVQMFRAALPKASFLMLSNGSGFLVPNLHVRGGKDKCANRIAALLDSGVNMLALEDYKHAKFLAQIRQYTGALPRYPDDPKLNPHRRFGPNEKLVIEIQDLTEASHGTHSYVNNHCGNGAPPNDKMVGKRCEKPFRELTVTHEGKVPGCCNDWRMKYLAGDLMYDSVETVWNGVPFQAMRQMLYHGHRTFGACLGCDQRASRPGLLPDQLGKVVLPEPTEATHRAIDAALAHEPLTNVNPLPWE